MPRNKKLEFTIDEPWELVVAAYDEKMYHIPTPDQPEIISMRFSNFHWDEETNITTLSRDSEATIPCPAFVLRYLTTETTLCARFDETVDRNNRRLITLMHNTNLQDMAALSETTIFMAHPDDPNKTLLTVDCNMTIHSTSWIIPKLEGIVIKFYSDALRKARKKDGKRIDDFRELLRAEGRDELSLLSRSEVEAREMAEELKHKGIDPNAVPEDDEGEDDDSDDEFFDAESDEDEDEPADDGGSEEQLDVVEGAGFIAGIDADEFVVPGEVGIDALPDDETADSGHLRDGELSYEGDSDPDAPMQAKRRGTVRQRLKKAAGKAGAATFWVTATAARKTVKGVRVAVVTSGHAAGHAAGIAKKKAARVVVRKKGSRRRRGDSIRRMNVYKTSTSAPYTWQQFEGTTNYEMALHARKMQLESDWMAEKRRDGSPSVGSPQRPPSQIVEDPPDVGELAAVQPDELEDWLNEGTADDGAPADPLSSVADPPADARRSPAHQDHKREGGSDAESEEDASSRPFVLAPEEVVEIAEVSPKATEAVDARPEVCRNGDTDSVEGSATESVTDATSGASIDDIAQPDVSGGRRSASTHDGDAGDTSIDAGSVDRGSIPSISLGDDTCTDILFDEPGVSESTDVHEESTLEFTSEILQKEYDLILSELARLTRSKMLIDRRPNDDFAAVGDASSAPDFGMLFAMESLEALSSSDPVVVAQARFDVLQKHVTALKQLYVGSSENELGEVRDVLKALAKEIGKDVNLDCTLSPSQPKTRGQRRRAAKAPRSPAVSKRSSTPKEPPLGDTEGSSGAEGIPIPCGRGGSQSSLRQSASSLPLAQAGTDNCSQGSPPVETAAPAKSKGYLSRVKQLKTRGAKAVSGAAAKVTAKKSSTQQTDHDSTSSL